MKTFHQYFSENNLEYYAQISDKALDKAYGYGLSSPGSFGFEANKGSAAAALELLNRGIEDVEQLADAIHRGWAGVARTFNDPIYATKPEKKIVRLELASKNYKFLPEEEKEKDRVVARALLSAFKGSNQY
jgi:hypothetical protein